MGISNEIENENNLDSYNQFHFARGDSITFKFQHSKSNFYQCYLSFVKNNQQIIGKQAASNDNQNGSVTMSFQDGKILLDWSKHDYYFAMSSLIVEKHSGQDSSIFEYDITIQ